MWRSGAITAQSFAGADHPVVPELRRGQKYQAAGRAADPRPRLELGLKEYGRYPFPAYSGAELVGVRMSPLGTWTAADDEEPKEIERRGIFPRTRKPPPTGRLTCTRLGITRTACW